MVPDKLTKVFHEIGAWEYILIQLKVGLRGFNEEGDASLPKVLMYFNGGLSCSLDVFNERFSVTLNRRGAL